MATNDTTDTTTRAPHLSIAGLDTIPAGEHAAIRATLGSLLAGFAHRNIALLENVYADDADWVNAFGSVKKGRVAILDYLRGLFADANFNAGALVSPPSNTLRRLSDDIVVISTHLR